MSDLFLTRRVFTDKSTVGKLIMDMIEIWCLEDTARNIKIDGETCIPSGVYKLEIRDSARYKRPMPYLINVPYYEGVMIHWGNVPENTRGCLLVGMTHPSTDFIGESKKAFDLLYPQIEVSVKRGPTFVRITGGYSKKEFEDALLKNRPEVP